MKLNPSDYAIDAPITIGRLNSDAGKAYAQTLRASALVEIADRCSQARNGLEPLDMSNHPAEQSDAALYYDLECLLRQVAKHAHVREAQ